MNLLGDLTYPCRNFNIPLKQKKKKKKKKKTNKYLWKFDEFGLNMKVLVYVDVVAEDFVHLFVVFHINVYEDIAESY